MKNDQELPVALFREGEHGSAHPACAMKMPQAAYELA